MPDHVHILVKSGTDPISINKLFIEDENRNRLDFMLDPVFEPSLLQPNEHKLYYVRYLKLKGCVSCKVRLEYDDGKECFSDMQSAQELNRIDRDHIRL